jgi:hypothetical protein
MLILRIRDGALCILPAFKSGNTEVLKMVPESFSEVLITGQCDNEQSHGRNLHCLGNLDSRVRIICSSNVYDPG